MKKILFESRLKKALEALKKKFSVSVGNNDSLTVKTNSSDKFMYNRIKDILDNAKIGKYYLSATGTAGNYNVVFEFIIRQKIKTLIKEQLNIIKESEKDDMVVVNDNIMGHLIDKNKVYVLRALVTKGASHVPENEMYYVKKSDKIRKAEKGDYKTFRIYKTDINESKENDIVKIFIDGYPWYLQKIDSTHFHMSNSPNKIWNSMSYHIGQHRSEPYYSDVDKWLHGGFKIDDKKYFSDGKNESVAVVKDKIPDRVGNKKVMFAQIDAGTFIQKIEPHQITYTKDKNKAMKFDSTFDLQKQLKRYGYSDRFYELYESITEKAVSKAQQRFFGMVHAAQKGEKPASKEIGDVAKKMKKKDVKDFAKTKHDNLPERVPKKENIEEEIPWDQDRSQRKNKIKNVPKKFKDIYKKSDIERSSNKKQFDGKKK